MGKSFFIALLLGCLYLQPQAQLLTTNPLFPVDSGLVTIVVDCSKGNQGLYNYSSTSDVYVHCGVITSLSTGSGDWKYVPFTWGTTNAAARATYLGNNQYSFTISNIRTFFGVPSGEKILKIAILFRNGSGSLAQRNSDASDMYVTINDGSLAAAFFQPPFKPTYTPTLETLTRAVGDSLSVKFAASQTSSLAVYFNGTRVDTATSGDSLVVTLPITQPGNQQLVGIAKTTSVVSDTISFFVAGAVPVAALPAGVSEGINYEKGDTSVTLVLYAPHKSKIIVKGDFNGWVSNTAYIMNRTPDSSYYWLRITGLTSGTEYAYQYTIDDSIIVADYNTGKVLDKNVDPTISATTYPSLKSFPSGASGSLASVIQTGKAAYSWQVSTFQRPAKERLVIYELHVRDFLASSNWQTLKDTLSYLRTLGVNAIEVMPFNNFEGASSWGYNPNFYFAPDKVYGTETALKAFVDACHQQGIAVIMDMVLNHSFGSSPMVQMYYDNALGVPAANNPWFNQYATHAYNVGFQFNHESAATKTFTQRVVSYWLTNYHIDGYRFDLAKGFTQKQTCDATGNNCDVAAWGHYDSSRVAIWDSIYNQIQAVSSGAYCILEMFADADEQQVEAAHGMMLWQNLNDNFAQATMGYGSASPSGNTWDLTGGLYNKQGYAQPALVVYQESHDEERLQYKNEQYGNSSGSYNITTVSTGLQRDAMAAAFWALMPGPKMMWEFGELGYDKSINTCADGTISDACRTDAKPVGWAWLSDTSRVKLHDVYKAMLKLRSLYPGLATPATSAVDADLSGSFKHLGVTIDSLSVMVAGNFDVASGSGSITLPVTGTWYNLLTGEPFTATGSAQSLTLAAGEYKILTSKNLTGTVTTATTDVTYSRNPFGVRVYPNPVSNGNASVEYELPSAGKTSVEIMDCEGRMLIVNELGVQASGKYTLSMSQLKGAAGLASGYYAIRVVNGQQRSQAPFLVVRQ